MGYGLSIVHLSDLHFGQHSRFKDRDPAALGAQLQQTLVSTLKARFNVEKPDIVIATGDFTQQALVDEFDQARRFFESLQEKLGIGRSRFVFVPGNHDLSWEASKAYFEAHPDRRGNEYDSDLQGEMLARFDDFKTQFYKDDAPKMSSLARGAVQYRYPQQRLCVVGLNSCEQETPEWPLGVVSKAQANAVMALWRDEHKDDVRILALHHPVNVLPDKPLLYLEKLLEKKRISVALLERFKGDALSVDGNDYLNRIIESCRVHLLLHGHQHADDPPHPRKWFEPSLESCQICPAGSFGLRPDEELIDQPNCFNLIRLQQEGSRLRMARVVMEYDPVHKERFSLDVGFYRDMNRRKTIAEFPLLPAQTGAFSDWIAEKIKEVLVGKEMLVSRLSGVISTPGADSETLSRRLVTMGFAVVWRMVVGKLDCFNSDLDALRRTLFLLAQAECKGEIIEEIRRLRESGAVASDFSIRIRERYSNLMGLVLSTAFGVEFSGAKAFENRLVSASEPGLDQDRLYLDVAKQLMLKLKIIADNDATTEEIRRRLKNLEGRLRAFYDSNEPMAATHRGAKGLGIPYLMQFILPPETRTGSEAETFIASLTNSGDDYIDQLMIIIMEKTENR